MYTWASEYGHMKALTVQLPVQVMGVWAHTNQYWSTWSRESRKPQSLLHDTVDKQLLSDCTETPCVSTATYTLQVCMYLQINVHAHYTSSHMCTNGQCILSYRLACMNCSICWSRTSLTLTMWQCVVRKCCTNIPCGTYSHYPTIRYRYIQWWIKV